MKTPEIEKGNEQMKRWSDAKLEKELAFARGFNDPSFEAVQWLKACEREASRRKQLTGGADRRV